MKVACLKTRTCVPSDGANSLGVVIDESALAYVTRGRSIEDRYVIGTL